MYIRTKDGVYVLSEAYWAGNKDEILAEADTIEELCDGFYIDFVNYKGFDKDKIGEPYTFEEFRDCFITYREYEGKGYTHCEGYAFIKTSKGLIYVAKMNENGELCLL